MEKTFTRFANAVSRAAGRPLTFVVCCVSIIIWGATGPLFGFSDSWQLVVNTTTTIITFLMVFLIQNTQNRDGAAIQAKLDELLRAVSDARNDFIGIEHLTERELAESLGLSRVPRLARLEQRPTQLDDHQCVVALRH
jgi:low affinity Fe/Cu permease